MTALPKELTTVTPVSKFIAVVIFLVLPFLGFIYGMKYQQLKDTNNFSDYFFSSKKIKRIPTPTPFPRSADNFFKTGNLKNDEVSEGSLSSAWSFLYEEPGAPALKLIMVFTPESKCFISQENTSCSTSLLKEGDRLNLAGFKKDNYVIVTSLSSAAKEENDACAKSDPVSREKCLQRGNPASESATTGLPNPASVFCQNQGGKVDIRKNIDGSESGRCTLPSGQSCDEWSFFRTKSCQ